ncbi:MAG: hypothetical protein KBA31_13560 [Alphaproteobacteria bacterium]|nr:hypothetical protein [Alphaproteobacteria bacterium]
MPTVWEATAAKVRDIHRHNGVRLPGARMERDDISVSALAKELQTSRNRVNRILDPLDHSITLATLERAAAAVGCKVKLELVKT